MHSLFGKRSVLLAGLLALAVTALASSSLEAKPEPGAKPRGFRLFARSLGALTINRVYCGLATTGEVCVDSTNSSTIGGGYWPKGTPNQFVFNSGLQLAGVIGGTKPANPWGGDTTGGFFFDPKGTTQHGQQVEPIYNASNPDDVANWPQAALVPQGDAGEEIFNPLLRGRVSASQGDVWWLSWEGNPAQNAGRSHPLGVVVETRGMGWNFPAGNEDIVYFVYTFYNVTSLNEADYASIRPGLREIMIARAREFHSLNNAAFGIDLPDEGYPINNMFAAFGADMDVTDAAGSNYSSVVLPFALGHTYLENFARPSNWAFDPGIFGAPFFESSGFVGVKYLKSPTGAGAIQLFSNTINGGAFGDARDTKQLFRYLSGTLSPAAGDQPCNTGNPAVTRICFVNNGNPADMRFFQSSTPLSLLPGQFGSIVVAYIFAAPYKPTSYTPGTRVRPESPLRMASVDSLNTVGANMVDSIAGFLDFNDANTDGIPQQNEFVVVAGSLLGKALVAQAVFDSNFLLPFAPESPEFFLVPGDNQVTILWRPSATETVGDPFFAVSSTATVTPPGGGAPVPNPLYDPNYRQFDVEGYRIYRGRVDAPNALRLIAQFDYAGTLIEDFGGTVNPTPGCAPELQIITDCAVDYDTTLFGPGETRVIFHEVPLVGQIIQIKSGGRVELADGNAIILAADTAVTGLASGFPELIDNGVPFAYTDTDVRNGFRYFYSVTAFDVNSFQSGPTNLESPRITKSVTPGRAASNVDLASVVDFEIVGDDGNALASGGTFTIDPSTGRFSGRPPMSIEVEGAIEESFRSLLPALSSETPLVARIDSVKIRADHESYPDDGIAAFNCQGLSNGQGLCHEYFVTYEFNGTEVQTRTVSYVPILSQTFGDAAPTHTTIAPGPLPIDEAARQRFGIPGNVTPLAVGLEITLPRHGLLSAGENFWGRRANANISPGGSRWFTGDNETLDDPAWGTRVGALPGVSQIFAPLSHIDTSAAASVDPYPDAVCMQVYNYAASTFGRQADIEVVWGAGGTLTRVRDLTHNVDVPFRRTVQSGYGFVTDNNGNGKIDWHDIRHVEDIIQVERHLSFCGAPNAPTTLPANGSGALLVQNATVTPVSTATGAVAPSTYATTGNGFGLYIAGHFHIFQLTGAALPAAGTRWVLRSYSGAVNASAATRATSNPEGYTYTAEPGNPPISGLRFQFTTPQATAVRVPTTLDLEQVHTVPDPYYVTSEFEQTSDNKVIKFVNLPHQATVRIYSSSGILVSVIEHNSSQLGGSADWDVRNRNNQVVASGVYFYHIEAGDARRVGRFTVVNFAQ